MTLMKRPPSLISIVFPFRVTSVCLGFSPYMTVYRADETITRKSREQRDRRQGLLRLFLEKPSLNKPDRQKCRIPKILFLVASIFVTPVRSQSL
jgi:hypothetical protein